MIEEHVALEILQWPDEQLKEVAQAVTKKESQEEPFRRELTMLRNTLEKENGLGIAATQVGWHKRIIIVDNDVFFNPSLQDLQGEQWVQESCLSVPLPPTNVKRYEDGTVTARDENWEKVQFYVTGLECAIFQHEIDHLKGILYIDRIPELSLDLLKRKAKKIKRRLKKHG